MFFLKQLWKVWQWGIGKALLATVAAHANSISVGLCQGYSAVLIPQLMTTKSAISVTQDEASWIAALGVISNPVGALVAGILMELFGRKTTIKITILPYLIGWLLIANSDDIAKLYAGRFVSGLAVGMATASYVYVAEVSPCAHRGMLSAMGPVHVSLGVLLVYVLGFLAHWHHVAVICTFISVLCFLAMCLVPESPAWLVTHDRVAEAKEALMWLRGNPNLVDMELGELLKTVGKKTTKLMQVGAIVENGHKNRKRKNMFNHFKISPNLWKPFLILVFFFAVQEGSGIYIILYYAVTLFQEVGTGLNEYVASIVVAVMRLFMSIVGAILIKNFGRKTLSIISGVGMGMSMAVCGTYEHFYSGTPPTERPYAWIPLVCVLLHVCVSMIGFLQIPWVMTGELFPLKVRGIMGGVVSSIAHLFIFASVKTFPDLLSTIGMDKTLWVFCLAAFIGAVYCSVILPETKGKTLREIELHFNKNSVYKKTGSEFDNGVFILNLQGSEVGVKSKSVEEKSVVKLTTEKQSDIILQRTLEP